MRRALLTCILLTACGAAPYTTREAVTTRVTIEHDGGDYWLVNRSDQTLAITRYGDGLHGALFGADDGEHMPRFFCGLGHAYDHIGPGDRIRVYSPRAPEPGEYVVATYTVATPDGPIVLDASYPSRSEPFTTQ
jgi:hypothetical protein